MAKWIRPTWSRANGSRCGYGRTRSRKRNPRRGRDYEMVGYVLAREAELVVEGQTVILEPGDSWLVPAGAEHAYRILSEFTAVEATSPPAQVHGRDAEVAAGESRGNKLVKPNQ